VSILVVGLSHRTAPVALLERVALDATGLAKLLDDLAAAAHVDEALVLSTCNRVELYVDVERFHSGVADVSELLARHTGVGLQELTPHLYVHYEDRATAHLFSVACGLDSMVVGESQILGQIRHALRTAQEAGSAGRTLHALVQQALRVGKRAHSDTGIDQAGQSLVTVGLELAEAHLGPLAGRTAVVVGAGSMSSLAAATLRRRDLRRLLVVNRTLANAERLAEHTKAEAVPFDRLDDALAAADLVITCTGAVGTVVSVVALSRAAQERAGRPQFVLDLALPRDVETAAREVPGVALADLESLGERLAVEQQAGSVATDVEAVREIVAAEVTAFAGWQRAAAVAPTVVALRSKADEVVDRELTRLTGRLPDLDDRARDEITQTVRRVVDKLLHAPTVRVKELADAPGGHDYAGALRDLFDLDLRSIDAVSHPGFEEDAP
jgi:glutamyl-tRNA reductase